MEVNNDLNNALCEVRKAYRLIAIYQRRILDMAKVIQKSFDFKPYVYENHDHNINIGGNGRFPTERCSFDMLPMYPKISLLFLPQNADYNNPKANEFMLDIRFESDTGYKNNNKQEPKPEEFDDVDQSETKMYLYAFGVLENLNSCNWYVNIWGCYEYPTLGELVVDGDIWVAGKSYDLCTVPDENSLNILIDDFKKFVEDKQNEAIKKVNL